MAIGTNVLCMKHFLCQKPNSSCLPHIYKTQINYIVKFIGVIICFSGLFLLTSCDSAVALLGGMADVFTGAAGVANTNSTSSAYSGIANTNMSTTPTQSYSSSQSSVSYKVEQKCKTCLGNGRCSTRSAVGIKKCCHGSGNCWNCNGTKRDYAADGTMIKCGACNGTGNCFMCNGTGKCKACGGTGKS